MKVRVNATYIYHACGWDRFHACQGNDLANGTKVRVINLYGAPKANTMGQCYVADIETGKFLCMVSTSSLYLVSEYIGLLKAKMEELRIAQVEGR